jgi:hypothetical protein
MCVSGNIFCLILFAADLKFYTSPITRLDNITPQPSTFAVVSFSSPFSKRVSQLPRTQTLAPYSIPRACIPMRQVYMKHQTHLRLVGPFVKHKNHCLTVSTRLARKSSTSIIGNICENDEVAKILPFLALPDGAHLVRRFCGLVLDNKKCIMMSEHGRLHVLPSCSFGTIKLSISRSCIVYTANGTSTMS